MQYYCCDPGIESIIGNIRIMAEWQESDLTLSNK